MSLGVYWKDQQLHLHVFAQPKASKNELVGWHEQELKIRLAAPPVDGAANMALIEAIAKWFKVKKSYIEIRTGHNSRHKHLVIQQPNLIPELIAQHLSTV
jgi:uncharacterized protein (TIGR00251 family)